MYRAFDEICGLEPVNARWIQTFIKRIRKLNATVADGMAGLARNFQYDKILALIQK